MYHKLEVGKMEELYAIVEVSGCIISWKWGKEM